MTIELSAGEREFLLAFADDEHLMGQRHTEWIGIAPFLEEDLAFASIGQDELGHAAMLYALVDDDIDRLALFRRPDEYRSCALTEAPCRDWADALVRHFLYDAAEELRWNCVAGSRLGPLADAARRALREEEYHRRHARALIEGLRGDPDAATRLGSALSHLLPMAIAQFEPVAGEAEAVSSGLANAAWGATIPVWQAAVDDAFGPLRWPSEPYGAGRTVRSDAFAALYSEIREVVLLDPDARW